MTEGEHKKVSEAAKRAEPSQKSATAVREEAILAFWDTNEIFKKTLEKDPLKGEYVFYDGPPFATGLPHYGHLLQSFVKDVVPRYKTMCGYRVARQWGWDCHGLPIENIVEKELGTKSKKDIVRMGVKKFNDLCRARIFTFIGEWERIIPRIGRFVDMKNAYRTMDFSYMEGEWWAFKTLHDKGFIYEDYRSMHICPRCETTLSQGEVAEGYEDVKDLSATVKFELVDEPGTFLLAWTTTPWTLPGNVALAVGADIDYVKVEDTWSEDIGDASYMRTAVYILSKNAYEHYKDQLKKPKIIEELKGKDLSNKTYKPLFDHYSKDEKLKNRENGWKVYAADFVTTDTGTGIVHIAPAFGADDMALGKKENLPFIQHVKMDGTFVDGVFPEPIDLKPRAKGRAEEVRDADITIWNYLAEQGKIFDQNKIKYEHAYPHCWRCDTALLNYATSSWFVAVEKMKPTLLSTAENIHWSPAHIKEGRFGKWLEGARDWSISRQRFWANTIPVWRCMEKQKTKNKKQERGCGKEMILGSAKELENAGGKKVSDLHKDIVDEITFPCPDCGGLMKRIPDVLDTWFDSGSVPYASLHYPFENRERFTARMPADFIGEAQDQTRAWFYYLHVLAGGLFEKPAFKNCIVTGLVLAKDGKKMSKKLNNYPDPMEVVDTYGADALRMYVLSSPIVQGENLNFSEKGIDEIVKKNIGRLHNVLAFYELYADGTVRDHTSANVLDRWIMSRLAQLVDDTTAGFESYRLDIATRPIAGFIDDLSVWYIRRSRDRFKAAGPVTSSASLRGPAGSSTVPISTAPETASSRLASEATGLAAQDKRDALATLRYVLHTLSRVIAPTMPFYAEHLFQAVREEEDEESVHLSMWPDKNVAQFDPDIISIVEQARAIVSLALEIRDKASVKVRQPLAELIVQKGLNFADDVLKMIADEVNVKTIRIATEEQSHTVLLNTEVTPELREEGLMRELVRYVQGKRKEMHLVPSDTIRLTILENEAVRRQEESLRKTLNASEIVYALEWQGTPLVLDEKNMLVGIEVVRFRQDT